MLLSSSNCAPLLLENWLVVALWPKKAATQAWACGHVRMNPVTPSAGGLSLHHRIWRQTQGHGSLGCGSRLRPEGSLDCVAPWFPAACPHDAMMAWTTPAGRCCVSGPMAGDVCCVPFEQKRRAPKVFPRGPMGHLWLKLIDVNGDVVYLLRVQCLQVLLHFQQGA